MRPQPPRWLDRFLEWYCKPALLEEIMGDLHELYDERLESGEIKAKCLYALDVLRFFKRSNLRFLTEKQTGQNSIFMFKTYLTIAFRNLKKNPLNTVINVLGLSIAVAFGLRAYAYYQWINRVDQFHAHKDTISMLTYFSEKQGASKQYGNPPLPIGQFLAEDFTEVQKVARIENESVVVKYRDNVFYEQVRFADPTYLDMLSFPLKWGTKESLQELNSIIISEKMSEKYFRENDPRGVTIELVFSPEVKKAFVITGVAAPFPSASSMHFDFLANFDNLQHIKPDYSLANWSQLVDGMLIQTNKSTDLSSLAEALEDQKATFNDIQDELTISSFHFEPVGQAYRKDIQDRFSLSYLIDEPVIILGTIAFFLLLLSCFNYANIAIFTATRRLKEIGLRKTLGARRGMIISQFLIENLFVAAITIFIGYVVGAGYIVPQFEQGIGVDLELSLLNFQTWVFLILILLTITVLSGIYPALFVSKYETSRIFRGNASFGKKNVFTKIFLSIQLILAAITITFSIMTIENAAYTKDRSWGYDHEYVSYISVPNAEKFESLKFELSKLPGVVSVAGSSHHLGKQHHATTIEFEEQKLGTHLYDIDEMYFSVMGFEMHQGRSHQKNATDATSIVVNEAFVEATAMADPIGQEVKLEGSKYKIIGVVKDFHAYNFEKPISPVVFRYMAANNYHYLAIKGERKSDPTIKKELKSQWNRAFPEVPFQGGHQEQVWGNLYWSRLKEGQTFFMEIAFISVLLVSLGLYGLVALNVGGRTREFSIRKVLGAEIRNISKNVLRPYTTLYLAALLIGIPISYFFVDMALGFIWTYHVPMNFDGIVAASGILIFMLLLVVLIQVSRVVKRNPVVGLRTE